MNPEAERVNSELDKQILDFCRHIAGKGKIVGVALVDNYTAKPSRERVVYEVMLVIRDFQPRLMNYIKTVNNNTLFVFTFDQWIFERDIERGFLGEAIASKLIFPHRTLFGEAYLHKHEVELKKRLVLELLENLVFAFPELVSRMQILPQYFLYEVLSNRFRVFPLLAYDSAGLTNAIVEDEQTALAPYNEALKKLYSEGKITLKDQYVMVTQEFIDQCQDPKIRMLNLTKNAPRALFTSLFGVLPQLMNVVSSNSEEFLRTQKINLIRQFAPTTAFFDPQKYVFFPTENGLVSLSDKTDLKGFAKKLAVMAQSDNITVESVGGMLNDVYLISAQGNGAGTKVLAKRFKDWSGFKWFPLTLWSFGARSFSVAGQARLAKECAISEVLRNAGFNVPKILQVSNAERLVFMEFIEGENLSQAVKQIATAKPEEANEKELNLICSVGKTMARVHEIDISLGDTKPDNVLVKPDGTIFLIDFEQATRGGDKAWDIAVFLYYCGHYLQQFDSNAKAEAIAKAFIEGYLRGGGDVENVRKAGSPKYRRVFSIFTLPAVINAISNECKNAKKIEAAIHG